jgi:tripartite-type tricarboxylate transporter receptor subunit TctC
MKAILLAALLAWGTAFAQPYPAKPIRVAVAFPPGGPTDIIARLIGAKMSDALGQPVVVENVAGASGNLATARVAKAPPDGYTLLVHSSAYAVNPSLSANAGYDGEKDFLPAGRPPRRW